MGIQISGSGSTIQKFLASAPAPAPQPWLEPTVFGNKYHCFYKCNRIRFVVRFFVLIKLPLYFISIEIFSN